MKLVLLNDTHAGVRNSSEIFIEYQRKFYQDVLFPYMDEHGIKKIVHGGDYYDHRKYVNFKALNANRKHFIEPMVERGITMDIIPGNHDVAYKNTNDLCSLKELLGYYKKNINIVMNPTVMDYDGFKLALLPWINPENYEESMKFVNTCDAAWLFGHLELVGFEMMKGIPNNHGMEASVFSRFEKVLSGHFHTKSIRGNIEYLGSQMEFTWSDYNDPKYFHVIDTETREITPVKNPITIFEKIVYNDQEIDYNVDYDLVNLDHKYVKIVVAHKSDAYAFDKFVSKVQNQAIHDLKIVESFDEFLGDNVELDDSIKIEDTPNLLENYIDKVDTDLNKEKLKNLMKSVWVEALNMEIS
jgi:hypothetical protein